MKRKLIDGDRIRKNWMPYYYRRVKAEVRQLNSFVSDRHKIKIEPSFKRVKQTLISVADNCNLHPGEVDSLFLIAMSWIDPLKVRAKMAQHLTEASEHRRSLSLQTRSYKSESALLKRKEAELLEHYNSASENPTQSPEVVFLKQEITILKWSLDKISGGLKSGKVPSVKNKVLADLVKILRKNLTGRGSAKTAYLFANELIETIFNTPKTKTGPEKKVAAAISNHNKKSKLSSKKK